LEILILL